ncbi:MAG TPA: hypothetical protein K8V21_07600 [Weissella thailandensis]|uniref:hypothetical protein n=1 Tax=Weissella thailandensis TaxID=89061 RepID=UPI001DC722FC|nr:hypothetical protein [Weissella thailandensis]HJG85230.1 hypothetical protein [Weissella thailandensis]
MIDLPKELLEGKHWCVWQLNKDGGKQPYNARTGVSMSDANSDPVDYYTAEAVAKSRSVTAGVGFIFTGTNYIGIDVDHLIGNTVASAPERTQETVDALLQAGNGYWEYSVSGTGYHFIIPAKAAQKLIVKPQYDKYSIEFRGGKNNFSWLALTGNGSWNEPTIGDAPTMRDVALELYRDLTAGIKHGSNDWMSDKISSGYSKRKPHIPNETIAKITQYHPEIIDYLESGYPADANKSDIDYAVVKQLYFWTMDLDVVIDMMTSSALNRSKFNRRDYFEITLKKIKENKRN